MTLDKSTIELQNKLADYAKGIEVKPIEGVRPDRLHHYRRLIGNIFQDVLESAYPLTLKITGADVFTEMVKDFLKNHPAQSPQYWRLPQEFMFFIEERDYQSRLDLPFLNELLLFEWLEIEVHTMKDVPLTREYSDQGKFMANPYLKVLQLDYPVHQSTDRETLVDNKGVYFIVIYRDLQQHHVGFKELNQMSFELFQLFQSKPGTVDEYVQLLLSEPGIDNSPTLKSNVENFLQQMESAGLMFKI